MGEMRDTTDVDLLRDYAEHGHEAAFRELVTRYTDLVYSAALRQLESADLAGDITQGVFLDLARKARSVSERLAGYNSLAGWLHRSTRYAVLNHLRDTRRRVSNERQAMEQLLNNAGASVDWEQIRPALDEALDGLGDEDREALLLRYFKNQDLRTVGAALGISDDAAQKRVSRAVERLREFFVKRGVTIGAGGLVAVVSANAVQAAPAGLALTISTAAVLGGTAVATTATATATKAIAMTTLQKTIIGMTLTVAVGGGVYEATQASRLRDQVQMLQQQQAPLVKHIEQLQKERGESSSRITALREENRRLGSNTLELLRLRNEVGQIHRERTNSNQAATAKRPPAGARLRAQNSDARFLSLDELSNVGYSTPLKAIQTISWAVLKGSFDDANAGLSPDLLAAHPPKPQDAEEFKRKQPEAAREFKGLRVVAQKNISLDRVELKVMYVQTPADPTQEVKPAFSIQPLVKIGEEWKLGGNTRTFTEQWEREGEVFEYFP
jgi:RNA polymerase sigma factor (sigma-70 family)